MTFPTQQQVYTRGSGTTPLGLIAFEPRDPTTFDIQYTVIGKVWMNTSTYALWILVAFSTSSGQLLATWEPLSHNAIGDIATLTGNSGGAVGPDADGNVDTIGDGTTVTVVGNPATNTLTWSTGGAVATTYTTDSGNAIPAAGVLNVLGTTGVTTSGAGNTVTIHGWTFTCDSGSATAAANNLNVLGGSGCNTVGAGSTITINATGGGFEWVEVTGTTQAMAINVGYVANNVALVTLTLPAIAPFGSSVAVQGKGTGLFRIAQNAGQTIHFGARDSTLGVGGSVTATRRYDNIELLCTTANTDWTVRPGTEGDLTIV